MRKEKFFAKRSLSQHFLVAPEFLQEIAGLLPRGETVLEIGAGTGLLTAELAKRARKVVAVEIDGALIPRLEERLRKQENAEIVHADALAVDFSPYKFIFGSIPYHISSPLLFKILASDFKQAVLVLQAEFGERLVAQPAGADWSRLSVMTQSAAHPRILGFIPAACFSPQPKVDSVIVRLRALPREKRIHLNAGLVAALFQHKNQSVKKALLHSQRALGKQRSEIKKLLEKVPARLLEKRVRMLSLEELSELTRLTSALRA